MIDVLAHPADKLRAVVERILDQGCRARLADLSVIEHVADTLRITQDVRSLAAEIEKAMSFPGDSKSRQLKAVRGIVAAVLAATPEGGDDRG